MIDTTYIKAEKTDNSLTLTLIDNDKNESCGVRAMEDIREYYNEEDFNSDNVRFEFFEDFIANTEWEWISPYFDVDVLTDAPMLGIKDENDEVIEVYGYMDYAIKSLMQALYDDKKVILQKG